MFSRFRTHYPQGSLISELVAIESGQFIVRAIASVEGAMLATSLASASTIEQAEERARNRLFELIELEKSPQFFPVTSAEATSSPSLSTVSSSLESSRFDSSAREVHSVSSSLNSASSVDAQEFVETPVTARESFSTAEEVLPEVIPPAQSPASEVSASEISASDEMGVEERPAPRKAQNSSQLSVEVEAIAPESVASSFEEEEMSHSLESQVEPPVESQVEPPVEPFDPATPPMDFSDIIAQTNLEIKRLGWTNDQGRQYLLSTYGKRSRQLLSDGELIEFLEYLKSQPVPQ